METNVIIKTVSSLIETKIKDFCKKEDISTLTQDLAERFIQETKNIVKGINQIMLQEFFEGYDQEKPYIEENDKVYRFKSVNNKEFCTPLGNIVLKRRVYQADRGGKCIVPLDRLWNMEHEYTTLSVRESVLYSCAHNTPKDTVELLKKCSLIDISHRTVQRMVEKSGEILNEHEISIMEKIRASEEIDNQADVLVGSMDGVNTLTREKGEKKGRAEERPKKKKSIESCAWRNAMVGSFSFYKIEYPDQLDSDELPKPQRLKSLYIGEMPEERSPTFKQHFEFEVEHLLNQEKVKSMTKILLCDGHRAIWNYAENQPILQDFEFLIDFFHATEHLSKAAELLFGKKSDKAKNWYNKWRQKLKEEDNGVQGVINSINYFKSNHKYSETKIKEINAQLTYFVRNQSKMNYSKFVKSGFPIGSGVVEAACKTIVKQRMCRSGMRWSPEGGKPIVKMRAIVKSNRWENFWKEYKKVA